MVRVGCCTQPAGRAEPAAFADPGEVLPRAYQQNRLWCKENGVPPHFGQAQGLFAQGNRLFLRSCSHLYCIGDPKAQYDGAKLEVKP